MTPERWQRLQEIFDQAADLPVEQRGDFLQNACGADVSLLHQVQSLLGAVDGDHLEKAVHHAVADVAKPDPTGETIGQYRIVRQIGEGGMGVVYEAEQSTPRRLVALKVIRAGKYASERHRRLFQREAEALARLRHPGIATIYESGITADAQPFFAMEFVAGETLDRVLAKDRHNTHLVKADARPRIELFLAICDALTYAHQNGVIHRDIKPTNIVVQRSTDSTVSGSTLLKPRVKVLDFGLARITTGTDSDETLTEAGVVQGSLPYMSPEQVRGDNAKIDIRTDIYSLGVLLYELFTGRHPYFDKTPSLVEGAEIICKTPPKRFREIRPKYDEDLETIVFKALEKEPERRYSSVAALANDLERYLLDQPVIARPPSTVYQVRKLIQRNRAAFAGLLGALALLITFSISTWVQSKEIAAERDRANKEANTAKKVSDFLVDLFRYANPADANGVLTARDLLRTGQERVQRELKDQPELRARMLDNIGTAYSVIGPASEAVKVLEESLAVRDKAFGAGSENSAETWNALATTYYNLGEMQKSIDAAAKALEVRQKKTPNDLRSIAEAFEALALSESSHGQFDKAIAHIQEAIALDKKIAEQSISNPNPDEDDWFRSQMRPAAHLQTLGRIYRRKGEFAAAVPYLREALERQKKLRDEDLARQAERIRKDNLNQQPRPRVEVAGPLNELGIALNLSGQPQEGVEVLRQCREEAARTFGADHPNIAIITGNIASALNQMNRYAEAETEARSKLQLALTKIEPGHPTRTDVLMTLGDSLSGQGKLAEARPFFVQAVEELEKKFGPEDNRVAVAKMRLALQDVKAGKAKLAVPVIDRSLETLKKNGREGSWDYGLTLRAQGDASAALGKWREAATQYSAAFDTMKRAMGEQHPQVKETAKRLDSAKAAAKRTR
jgi:serine/threonine protein kinase